MGILRTILAIAVLVFHSSKIFGLRMAGGQVAVQTFYMISGFYMALILNEKYTGQGNYRLFMRNRLWRIYPVYWILLAAALLVSLIGYYGFNSPCYLARYISYAGCLGPFAILYFVLENVILVGQDILLFLGIDAQCHVFLTRYPFSQPQTGFSYLLVPQAWSISLELMFYAIAPFIVRRRWVWQLALVVASLGLRIYWVQGLHLSFAPWTYRFFPLELAFFVAGSLAYVCYRALADRDVSDKIGYALTALCVLGVIFYNDIGPDPGFKKWLYYGLVWLSLPFIFRAFKQNRTDRWIGELSFALYISHHLVVMALRSLFLAHPQYMEYYGCATLLISLVIAILLNKWVVEPLNRRREKWSLG